MLNEEREMISPWISTHQELGQMGIELTLKIFIILYSRNPLKKKLMHIQWLDFKEYLFQVQKVAIEVIFFPALFSSGIGRAKPGN